MLKPSVPGKRTSSPSSPPSPQLDSPTSAPQEGKDALRQALPEVPAGVPQERVVPVPLHPAAADLRAGDYLIGAAGSVRVSSAGLLTEMSRFSSERLRYLGNSSMLRVIPDVVSVESVRFAQRRWNSGPRYVWRRDARSLCNNCV